MHVLDPDALPRHLLDDDPGLAPLRMRHCVNATRIAGVLRQFGRARARGRIHEIEMNEPPVIAAAGHDALERHRIELITLESAAEAAMKHWIREAHLEPRILAPHVFQVRAEDLSHPLPREDLVLVLVKRADNP